jgi:hypothetical protein
MLRDGITVRGDDSTEHIDCSSPGDFSDEVRPTACIGTVVQGNLASTFTHDTKIFAALDLKRDIVQIHPGLTKLDVDLKSAVRDHPIHETFRWELEARQ